MSLEFEYTTTRVKGMKAKLLSESRMRQLLEVKSISEMIELLEETEYKEDFVSQSTKYKGIELVTRALHENFKHSMKKLVKINPDKGKQALKALFQEYEVQNISTVISAKATELPITETDLMIVGREEEKLIAKLMEAKNVPDLLKHLRKTEFSAAMKKAGKEYDKTQDFRALTRALHAYYFEKLHKLPRSEENLLWKLIESRNRIRNLMILLRVKRANASANAMQYLAEKGDRFLKELSKMNEFNKMLERVAQKYPYTAEAVEICLKKNELIPLEIALEREFINNTLKLVRFAVLDFAAILGYFYLKELEVAAIRKIAYAKQYGFTDELKGMIFSFNAG